MTSFRVPTLVDLYYPNFSNPNLLPERLTNYDATVTLPIAGELSLGFFGRNGANLIVLDPTTFIPYNASRVAVSGLQFTVAAPPLAGVRISASVTDLYRALDTATGLRLPSTPPITATLAIERPFGGSPFAFGVSLRIVGSTPDVPNVDPVTFASGPPFADPYNGYTTADAFVRYRVAKSAILTARVSNWTDERYAPVFAYPMPGRTITVELRDTLARLAAIALLVPLAAVFALAVGGTAIAPHDFIAAIVHPGTPSDAATIVWSLRLPRIAIAATVGASLALAGTLMQALLRNPLIDPYITGVSSGAGAAIAIAATLGVALAAVPGDRLRRRPCDGGPGGGAGPRGSGLDAERLILAGVSISALMSAFIALALTQLAQGNASAQIIAWLAGTLAGRGWVDLAAAAPYAVDRRGPRHRHDSGRSTSCASASGAPSR